MDSALPGIAALSVALTAAIPAAQAAEDGWKQLSLREKIGQTVVISSDPEREKAAGGGTLQGFFARYPVGGVFLGSWKFEQFAPGQKAQAIAERIAAYRAASRLPLFIQDDYEQGPGSAVEGLTPLPNLMALGAADSPELAADFGRTLALQARSLGLNWLLNPVADLNLNFMNPVIGTRAVSDDPERAVRLLTRQVRAMQDQGLIATIKHFPGDGVDFRDQHLVTTVNSLSLDEWRRSYGKVFGQLIRAGAASVMVGHITLPAFQHERLRGRPLPASLSHEVITGLLKQELGFAGVVISDALNMGGLQGYHATPVQTQIAAFQAGTDLLLWPSLEYIDALERHLLSGAIPMQRLDDAVARVWALKHRFGLLDASVASAHPPPLTETQAQADRDLATQVAEASITLVRDREHRLPLRADEGRKLLLVVVAPPGAAEQRLKAFAVAKAALEQRGFAVDLRVNLSYYEHSDLQPFDAYDRIVFAFDRHAHAPIGTLQLYEVEALTAWSANALPPAKVLSVSFGDPYVHDILLPLVGTCINAYSDSPASQLAVVRALTGEIPLRGSSPVDLEALRRKLHH